jgi:hypothetical protein
LLFDERDFTPAIFREMLWHNGRRKEPAAADEKSFIKRRGPGWIATLV